MYLSENNSVFQYIVDELEGDAEQFFVEFFSIYKTLQADSKILFAVSFFMKNLHQKFMEMIFELIAADDAIKKQRIVNLIELLGLIISSRKENAAKLFKSEVEIQGKKISFSFILNMLLLDNQDKIRDCSLGIISIMTE